MTFLKILKSAYYYDSDEFDNEDEIAIGELIFKNKWVMDLCLSLSITLIVAGVIFIWHNISNTNALKPYNAMTPIFIGVMLAAVYIYMFLCNRAYLEKDQIYNYEIGNLEETENLEEYEGLRTQFTLHNIKNAVINANNYMDVLRSGKMELGEATDNLQNCLDRIDEILEVFKDSDKAKKRTEFRAEELLSTFQMLYSSKMVRQKIKFEVVYQSENIKNQIVYQSYYDVFQVFNNLVINSRKALENTENKQVVIVADYHSESALRFQVSDTGTGILPEHQNKVFDLRFSTTGGDGIGLFHIRKTLQQMGGSIRLIAPFQHFSTTFEVIIPTQKT